MEKSWSTADMKSNAEYENYDNQSAMSVEVLERKDMFNQETDRLKYDNYWHRFTGGVRSIWATKQTEDVEGNKALYIKTTLRELVIYIIFLVILMIISFGMTSGEMYYFTNLLNGLFLTSQATGGVTFLTMAADADYWNVLNGSVLNGLYSSTPPNPNAVPSSVNYIVYESILIGLPRVRQVRVSNSSCIIPNEFQNTVSLCYSSYSSDVKSMDPYGPQNSTAWTYTAQADLGSMPFIGQMGSYEGGGFYFDLNTTLTDSLNTISNLYNLLWIDRGTRAVIIDFTIYNPNINLFCVVKMIGEFLSVGGVIPTYEFRTVKLIRYVTPMDYFILSCELIFLVFIIYYIVEESIEIRKHKFKYFKSTWNVLDVLVLSLCVLCSAFNIYRTIAVQNMLGNLIANENQHPNFDYLSSNQMSFNYMLAITVFLAWVKIFKNISFNKTMTQLGVTLSRCSKDLIGFAVMFLIIFMAFAQLGYLLFGTKLQDFSGIQFSIFTLYRIILGDFTFAEYMQVNTLLGPIYFILYVFFVFFVLFNMFLAIINDTFSEIKEEMQNEKNEFEIGSYFKEKTQMMLNKLQNKKEKIIDIQKAMLNADTNNDGKMDFDEWKTELQKRGYGDEEIEAVFAKYDTDGDRVLDEEEQLEMARELEGQKTAINEEIIEQKEKSFDDDLGLIKHSIPGVAIEEYRAMEVKVEQIENNIGALTSKIDMVLQNIENIDRTKAKRRKAMSKILNTLTSNQFLSEEERKVKVDALVQDEICKLNQESTLTERMKSKKKPSSRY